MVIIDKSHEVLYAVSCHTNNGRRNLRTTEEFIIDLFCRIDDAMKGIPKHSQSNLFPSEIVTLGILFALKGVGNRAFYRWLIRDYHGLFPNLPELTRLFRLFATHQAWTDAFMVAPGLFRIVHKNKKNSQAAVQ